MGLVNDPLQTHATQWLERTLDDSSNRRLVLPEAFLALDGALDILSNVGEGLVVWEATVTANLAMELPFMASENIMLAATRAGADRQEAHEVIRVHSMAAAEEVKRFGRANDLMARLKSDAFFAKVDLDGALDPASFVGRAPEQTDRFIVSVVEPIRARYRATLSATAELRV
jgi:adenylosuccinate lyase